MTEIKNTVVDIATKTDVFVSVSVFFGASARLIHDDPEFPNQRDFLIHFYPNTMTKIHT
jgi:hypothetical protein